MAQITEKKSTKKSFFEVKAPITSTKIMLYSDSIDSLENKVVKLDLSNVLRGKALELKLRIKKEDQGLKGIPEKLTLLNSYIRRIIRKGTDYVEDSFETECRDSKIRIKPFLLTRMRVHRSVLKAIRNETRKQIESYVKIRTTQELFSDIISNKLQKNLSQKIKKIYPLAVCEIRVFEIVKNK